MTPFRDKRNAPMCGTHRRVRTLPARTGDLSRADRAERVDIVQGVVVTDLHRFLELQHETPGPVRRLAGRGVETITGPAGSGKTRALAAAADA